MRFTSLDIEGAWTVAPAPFRDERGWFARVFCEEIFAGHGLETHFPQHSLSCSRDKGTLRGMHYQRAPHGETKLVACLQGAVWDVLVDLRPHSSTYLRWTGVELSVENGVQVYIPEGCAHGFQTLTDEVLIRYMISSAYTPDHAAGLHYNDPAIGIHWPAEPVVMSDKDRNWPLLQP